MDGGEGGLRPIYCSITWGWASKLRCRREICQHNRTTRFSWPKILHTKKRKLLLFSLTVKQCKCINIKKLATFGLTMKWMYETSKVSERNQTRTQCTIWTWWILMSSRLRICVARGGSGCFRPIYGRPKLTLFSNKKNIFAVSKKAYPPKSSKFSFFP